MKQQVQDRKRELRAEYEKGVRKLSELDRARRELEQTLLRISGAIQVLDELGLESQEGADRSPELRAVGQ